MAAHSEDPDTIEIFDVCRHLSATRYRPITTITRDARFCWTHEGALHTIPDRCKRRSEE